MSGPSTYRISVKWKQHLAEATLLTAYVVLLSMVVRRGESVVFAEVALTSFATLVGLGLAAATIVADRQDPLQLRLALKHSGHLRTHLAAAAIFAFGGFFASAYILTGNQTAATAPVVTVAETDDALSESNPPALAGTDESPAGPAVLAGLWNHIIVLSFTLSTILFGLWSRKIWKMLEPEGISNRLARAREPVHQNDQVLTTGQQIPVFGMDQSIEDLQRLAETDFQSLNLPAFEHRINALGTIARREDVHESTYKTSLDSMSYLFVGTSERRAFGQVCVEQIRSALCEKDDGHRAEVCLREIVTCIGHMQGQGWPSATLLTEMIEAVTQILAVSPDAAANSQRELFVPLITMLLEPATPEDVRLVISKNLATVAAQSKSTGLVLDRFIASTAYHRTNPDSAVRQQHCILMASCAIELLNMELERPGMADQRETLVKAARLARELEGQIDSRPLVIALTKSAAHTGLQSAVLDVFADSPDRSLSLAGIMWIRSAVHCIQPSEHEVAVRQGRALKEQRRALRGLAPGIDPGELVEIATELRTMFRTRLGTGSAERPEGRNGVEDAVALRKAAVDLLGDVKPGLAALPPFQFALAVAIDHNNRREGGLLSPDYVLDDFFSRLSLNFGYSEEQRKRREAGGGVPVGFLERGLSECDKECTETLNSILAEVGSSGDSCPVELLVAVAACALELVIAATNSDTSDTPAVFRIAQRALSSVSADEIAACSEGKVMARPLLLSRAARVANIIAPEEMAAVDPRFVASIMLLIESDVSNAEDSAAILASLGERLRTACHWRGGEMVLDTWANTRAELIELRSARWWDVGCAASFWSGFLEAFRSRETHPKVLLQRILSEGPWTTTPPPEEIDALRALTGWFSEAEHPDWAVVVPAIVRVNAQDHSFAVEMMSTVISTYYARKGSVASGFINELASAAEKQSDPSVVSLLTESWEAARFGEERQSDKRRAIALLKKKLIATTASVPV